MSACIDLLAVLIIKKIVSFNRMLLDEYTWNNVKTNIKFILA